MKKSLLALAVLGAYAGVASAQSSVTIFGIVDLSVNQIKNGSLKTTSMQSNQLNSNRLGFRGFEDLGGGLGAGFWLEGGNGQRKRLRDRTASTSHGSQRVSLYQPGRLVKSAWAATTSRRSRTWAFDIFGANGLGQDTNLISGWSVAGQHGGRCGHRRARQQLGGLLPAGQPRRLLRSGHDVALGQGNDNNKYWGGRRRLCVRPVRRGGRLRRDRPRQRPTSSR